MFVPLKVTDLNVKRKNQKQNLMKGKTEKMQDKKGMDSFVHLHVYQEYFP